MTAAGEIKYKIGNEKLVKVTGKAGAKLTSLLTRQGRPQGALRVAVIGGGCSGLQYKMDLVDGSELDFSEDLQKGGFKVTNPNAVAHCSCGESFSA